MKSKKIFLSQLLVVVILFSTVMSASAITDSEIPTPIANQHKNGILPVGGNIPESVELLPVGIDLPGSYNSRDAGYTTSVKTQQNYTCWAFGSLACFETLLLKNGIPADNYSAQHMNLWGTTQEDGTGWQRDAFSAGYAYIPLGYLMSWQGPYSTGAFPENSTMTDFENLTESHDYVATSATYFSESTSIDNIKLLVYKNGSVVANFNSDSKYLSGRYNYFCGDSSIELSNLQGHCVSIVGWDDNYKKENFEDSLSGTPQNDGAWIFKNSWGPFSGDRGYYYISYEDVWLFDDIFGPGYAITGYDVLDSNTEIYQNEIYGATYEFNYLGNYDNVVYMNAFDFAEKDRTLDKVIFESTSLGSDYTVYYVPFNGSKPSGNRALWQKLSDGKVDYSGYICTDFTDVEVPAGLGAIAIEMNSKNADGINSIGASEWLATGGKLIFKPNAKSGQSYYMLGNSVVELMSFYNAYLEDDIGGTFAIKAVTYNEQEVIPTETTPVETTTPVVTDPVETTTPVVTDPVETTTPIVTDPEPTTQADTTAPVVSKPQGTEPTTEASDEYINIYFTDTEGFGEVSYSYYDSDEGSASSLKPANFVRVNSYGEKIYVAQVPCNAQGIRFAGENPDVHTTYITEPIFDGVGFYPSEYSSEDGGCWKVKAYIYAEDDADISDITTTPAESTCATMDETDVSAETTVASTQDSSSWVTDVPVGFTYKLGDADLNGTVNIKDATYIQKYVANMCKFSELEILAANVNEDDSVNVKDATIIQKYMANMSTEYKIGEERYLEVFAE